MYVQHQTSCTEERLINFSKLALKQVEVMNKLLNILLLRYCTFYITNQQIGYSVRISFKRTFFLTTVTFSFRIRMSVTLMYVSVSLTHWRTLNGPTILSNDEPGNQDFDYKKILHNDCFITNHVRSFLHLEQKYQTVKHNKQYRILNPCQQTLYKHFTSISSILKSMYFLYYLKR